MPLTKPNEPTESALSELKTLVQVLRELIVDSVSLSGSQQELASLVQQARALQQSMKPHATKKLVARYASPHPDANAMLPYSPVSGVLNPLSPPFVMHWNGERLIAKGVFTEAFEGPPGCVHGGCISAVYDQVLAVANVIHGAPGPTGKLTVSYHRPTPLNREVRFEAWTERIDARKAFSKAECYVGDTLITKAEGVFVRVRKKLVPG